MALRTNQLVAIVSIGWLAGCGQRTSEPPVLRRIAPREPSQSSGPCAGLDYCACNATAACRPRFSEGCVCNCDFRCSADEPECMCACGGAKFLACEAHAEP